MLHQNRETISADTGDWPEWHRGREEYSAWLIELGSEGVAHKVAAARDHLSEFLTTPYQRQPHITVFVCGFTSDTMRYDDDYSTEQFERHMQLLIDAAIKPFTVKIGGLNSFESAPFLEVIDSEGGIERLRSLLLTTGAEIGRGEYVPHITVGLYSRAFPVTVVSEKMASFPKDPCNLTVDRITFASYRAREIAGELTWRHAVALRPT